MGIPRSTRRDLNGDVSLYPAETSLGWRVIRQVSRAEAAEKLGRGEWREVYDEHGNFRGCQALISFKKDEDLPSRRTAPSITVKECLLNAGLCGKSRTAGMTEEQRISRKSPFGRPLPPEDAIERAQAKVVEFGRIRLTVAPREAIELPPAGNWDAFQDLGRVEEPTEFEAVIESAVLSELEIFPTVFAGECA